MRSALLMSAAVAITSLSIPSIAQAEDVVPTRVQLVRLAEAELDVGRPAEAANTASRVIEDPPKADEGAAEIAAWERAREVFVKARERVAHLTVGVTGGVGVNVEVDGTAARRTSDLLVDPGEHVIVARSDGFESAVITVRLRAGESRGVALTLVPRATPETVVVAAPTPATPGPGESSVDESMQPARIAAYVTLGTGLGALTVGGIAGVIAINKSRHVNDACVNMVCAVSMRDDVDTARTWANVSTVGIVTGTLLLGASLALFIKTPSSKKNEKSVPRSVTSNIDIGPGAAFVRGTF